MRAPSDLNKFYTDENIKHYYIRSVYEYCVYEFLLQKRIKYE